MYQVHLEKNQDALWKISSWGHNVNDRNSQLQKDFFLEWENVLRGKPALLSFSYTNIISNYTLLFFIATDNTAVTFLPPKRWRL